MKYLRQFVLEKDDYRDPNTFEKVPGIDVSLTDLRKKMKIAIGDQTVELTREQAQELIDGMELAISRM